jgi:hypothetical protein
MKARFLGLIPFVALFSLSPASASIIYTYDVGFNIGTLSVTGTIVLGCAAIAIEGSCGVSSPGIWSFTGSDGVTLSSTDAGAYVTASPIYPLTATASAIIFNPNPPPGLVQFNDNGSVLVFQSADDVAPEIAWLGAQGYIISPASDVQIATIVTATPLPAALPLFATGLDAMGLFGWRRKRKDAAAMIAATGHLIGFPGGPTRRRSGYRATRHSLSR